MSPRRFLAPRAVTPLLAALVFVVIAVAWGRGPPTASATTTVDMAQAGGSCPLTSAQEINSIKTFKKMMPVFRHPRCTNCHGGIPDPLGSPTPEDHMGVTELSSADNNKTCEECHETGWRVPGPGFDWTGKNDEQLCNLMKTVFSSAQFVDHIVKDGGKTPFIEMGFAGMRGLNEAGQTNYEEDLKRALKAEKPPGTHAVLIQQARDWVTAQGGSFVGDADCGCVLDKMEVQFKSTMHITNLGPGKVISTITAEGKATLRLGPDSTMMPAWDLTAGPEPTEGRIRWSGVTMTKPLCTATITPAPFSDFQFWLGVSFKPNLKLTLEVVPGAEMHGAFIECRHPVTGTMMAYTDSVPHIFAAAWSSLHGGPDALPMVGLPSFQPGSKPTPPPAAIDFNKLQSMDLKALEAMAEGMKSNPTPAGMAGLGKLMNQLVPGADKMAEAARRNFKFPIPDARCKLQPGTPYLATCSITQTLTVSDNKGATQTITETTNISIGRVKP